MKLKVQLIIESDSGETEVVQEVAKPLRVAAMRVACPVATLIVELRLLDALNWDECLDSSLSQKVAAGFQRALAADESGLYQRSQQINGALLGDAQRCPNLGWTHAALHT